MSRSLNVKKSKSAPHTAEDGAEGPHRRIALNTINEQIGSLQAGNARKFGFLVNCHTRRPMEFRDDKEFTDFCLEKRAQVFTDPDTGLEYFDYPFTSEYLNAVSNGDHFRILDPGSRIMKRGCICRGIITKWIDNLSENKEEDN